MQERDTLCYQGRIGEAPPAMGERRFWQPARRALLTRGGLGGWQKKRVADYIEAHLTERIRLATLAGLVDLSPYHFARAFKQSFGAPPHRYHSGRRMERAKELLAEEASSVTAVAIALGFAETSSFSAAFRKITGASPSDYRRARRWPPATGPDSSSTRRLD